MQANALDARLPARGFRAVYRENLPLVRATIRRLGVPSWLEDDAVQDVFVVAHRRLDDFDGDRIDGWLVVIARRVAFRHRRSAQRHRRKLDALRTWMGFAPPERPWQAPEARVLLREMTRRLAAEQQQAFAWCEVEGYTAIEASQRYGVNPNTVSTRLRAARHELRRALVELPIDAAPRTRPRFVAAVAAAAARQGVAGRRRRELGAGDRGRRELDHRELRPSGADASAEHRRAGGDRVRSGPTAERRCAGGRAARRRGTGARTTGDPCARRPRDDHPHAAAGDPGAAAAGRRAAGRGVAPPRRR